MGKGKGMGLLVGLATPSRWRREPLKKWCGCGALVWDVQHPGQLSSFQARTVCPGCGHDHSRAPTLAWLVRFYWKRLLKRRRYFGFVGMWRQHYPVYFWRFREKAHGEQVERPVRVLETTTTVGAVTE